MNHDSPSIVQAVPLGQSQGHMNQGSIGMIGSGGGYNPHLGNSGQGGFGRG